ncbi:MAG: hypothetical protein H7Z21_03385 [Hymenobacter sp.]|nr:hypothetical protein [Hymenobacter sp.]
MTHKKKWLLFAPGGLVVIGLGSCLVQWAAAKKERGEPATSWILAGTAALCVLNAGISLFGRGVAESVLYQVREKEEDTHFDYSNVPRF